MSTKPRAGALVAILTAVVLLVAGGAVTAVLLLDGGDESTSRTVDDLTDDDLTEPGRSVHGIGYSYELPDGWEDISLEMYLANRAVDSAASTSGSGRKGLIDANIAVVYELSTGATVPDDLRSEWVDEVASTDTTSEVIAAPNIGGLETLAVEMEGFNAANVPVVSIAYLVIHESRAYTISFTTTKDAEDESRAALDKIVGSWTWK